MNQVLCAAFNLPEGIEQRLAGLETTKLIVEFILITRKLNNIITFYEIFKVIPFNYTEVLYELGNRAPGYIEVKKEELINRYLFDLGISYKEACITKYLIATLDDDEDIILCCVACLVITLRILQREQGNELNAVLNVFNKVGWPCKKPPRSNHIKQYLKKITHFNFTRDSYSIKNNYAKQVLEDHLWSNPFWLSYQVF